MMLDEGVREIAPHEGKGRESTEEFASEAAMFEVAGRRGMWKRKGAPRPASIRFMATAATAPRIATAFAEHIEGEDAHRHGPRYSCCKNRSSFLTCFCEICFYKTIKAKEKMLPLLLLYCGQ